jgi:hypothetical protein
METVNGKIIGIDSDGMMTILAPVPNIERACLRRYSEVYIGLPDGRLISPEQRRKAYALMGEISEATGYTPVEVIKEMTKLYFMTIDNAPDGKVFSLSNCDMTTARDYIGCLIDFIIENHIPVRTPLYELCEDIGRYVYACLMNKSCALCGKPADLHHVDAIGMGRNRYTVLQIGMPVLSLCRVHHIESHTMGQQAFLQLYHLQPIKLTVEIGKMYHLTKKNLGE